MAEKRTKSLDPLARLFREVSGDVPDSASLARMHRVAGAMNLHDNDALWSLIAVLEYYARLYEVIPERVRYAGEGSIEAARREVAGATEAMLEQHRAALDRCKATIQLAENLVKERETCYREALAKLNDASLDALTEQLVSRVVRTAGNRLIGAAAISAREQRERLDGAIGVFNRAVDAAVRRITEVTEQCERRVLQTAARVAWSGGLVALVLLLGVGAALIRR